MTIKDLEARTGMTRANIRYYEQEGLLSPVRLANGYRDYSVEDLKNLLRIKLLRQLRFSLEDIRRLQEGTLSFSEAMSQQSAQLNLDSIELANALQICQEIGRNVRSFNDLQAGAYLPRLEAVQTTQSAQYVQTSDLVTPHPWRRYLARSMDMSIAGLAISSSQFILFRQFPDSSSLVDTFVHTILVWLVLLLMEPFCLSRWGTTPGKWILGISVQEPGGGNLSFNSAFKRTLLVFLAGMGLGIPLISEICSYISLNRCDNHQDLLWEEGSVLRYRERRGKAPVLYAAGTAGVYLLTLLFFLLALLPPHHGDLTADQYTQNFEVCSRYLLDNEIFRLNTDRFGLPRSEPPWEVITSSGGYEVQRPVAIEPTLSFETKNGIVQAVTYTSHLFDQPGMVDLDLTYPQMAYFALAGSRPGTNIFNIIDLIQQLADWDEPFHYTGQWQDVTVTYSVESEGYHTELYDDIYLIPMENQPTNRLVITFRAEIVE